jgi:hypothetical protein
MYLSSFMWHFNRKFVLTECFAIQSIPNTSTFDTDDFPLEEVKDISAPKTSGVQ